MFPNKKVKAVQPGSIETKLHELTMCQKKEVGGGCVCVGECILDINGQKAHLLINRKQPFNLQVKHYQTNFTNIILPYIGEDVVAYTQEQKCPEKSEVLMEHVNPVIMASMYNYDNIYLVSGFK